MRPLRISHRYRRQKGANIREAVCYALSYYFKRKEKECNQWLTIKNTFNAWIESERDPEGPAHSICQLLKQHILQEKILPGIDQALALIVLNDVKTLPRIKKDLTSGIRLMILKTIFRENIDSMIKLFKKNKDILISTAIMISGIPLIILLCIILDGILPQVDAA